MGRKRYRQDKNKTTKPAAKQTIPELDELMEPLFKELLFRPLIYKPSSGTTIDFDHIMVPFMMKDGLVFMMMFMDSCGGLSAYTECCEADPEKPSTQYRDAMGLMKECLEIERLTGTEYYFGKLDKALERYLYSMQLFVDKGILDADSALEIVKELEVDAETVEKASRSVEIKIGEARMREEDIYGKPKARAAAGDIMMKFVMSILGMDDSEE